ncbi:MAG: hypothetical protein IKF72_14470 [Kiritimatiellae bacterium]|nr:hypothetical protein [Kiritimatiellia bacterium]
MRSVLDILAETGGGTFPDVRVVLAVICLLGLAVIASGAFAWWTVRTLTPVVRWVKRHGLQALYLLPGVLCLVYVGATKNGSVSFPYTDVEMRYLYDAGSYVTNDYVCVAFTKSAVVPDSADFLGYYRPAGSTNDAEWVCFLETTFAAFHSPSNVPFAGALTNDFQFFTTYTPGPVVHTNGVAVVNWQQNFERDGRYLATIRTGVYTNAIRVAPSPGITNAPAASLLHLLTTEVNQ